MNNITSFGQILQTLSQNLGLAMNRISSLEKNGKNGDFEKQIRINMDDLDAKYSSKIRALERQIDDLMQKHKNLSFHFIESVQLPSPPTPTPKQVPSPIPAPPTPTQVPSPPPPAQVPSQIPSPPPPAQVPSQVPSQVPAPPTQVPSPPPLIDDSLSLEDNIELIGSTNLVSCNNNNKDLSKMRGEER